MSDARVSGYRALTEREKHTLRLMLRGHDAKSLARHLDLSVHTVNERLREARRKLAVPSSRAAARLLHEFEAPEKLGDDQIGDAGGAAAVADAVVPTLRRPHRAVWLLTGGTIMSLMLGLFAWTLSPLANVGTVDQAVSATATLPEVVNAAERWLALSDQGRWAEGWRTAAASFRQANTAERWAAAARQVRVPMGALVSRTFLSQESVPAPPAGVEVVKFRASFANRRQVTETVSLAHEDGAWKVVGIYVE